MRFLYPNKPVRVWDPHIAAKHVGIPSWVVQPKWDGSRVEVTVEDQRVRLMSREGREWDSTQWGWLASLPIPQPWYGDGELLRSGKIVLWDLAVLGGRSIFHQEYYPRLQTLQSLLPESVSVGAREVSVAQTLSGERYQELLTRVGEPHMEGIVWKDKTAKNLWGPNSTSEVGSQVKYRF